MDEAKVRSKVFRGAVFTALLALLFLFVSVSDAVCDVDDMRSFNVSVEPMPGRVLFEVAALEECVEENWWGYRFDVEVLDEQNRSVHSRSDWPYSPLNPLSFEVPRNFSRLTLCIRPGTSRVWEGYCRRDVFVEGGGVSLPVLGNVSVSLFSGVGGFEGALVSVLAAMCLAAVCVGLFLLWHRRIVGGGWVLGGLCFCVVAGAVFLL